MLGFVGLPFFALLCFAFFACCCCCCCFARFRWFGFLCSILLCYFRVLLLLLYVSPFLFHVFYLFVRCILLFSVLLCFVCFAFYCCFFCLVISLCFYYAYFIFLCYLNLCWFLCYCYLCIYFVLCILLSRSACREKRSTHCPPPSARSPRRCRALFVFSLLCFVFVFYVLFYLFALGFLFI